MLNFKEQTGTFYTYVIVENPPIGTLPSRQCVAKVGYSPDPMRRWAEIKRKNLINDDTHTIFMVNEYNAKNLLAGTFTPHMSALVSEHIMVRAIKDSPVLFSKGNKAGNGTHDDPYYALASYTPELIEFVEASLDNALVNKCSLTKVSFDIFFII